MSSSSFEPQLAKEDVLEYRMLKAALRYHKYLYYQLNKNEISDVEYDALEKQFDNIAGRCGWSGSWVGYDPEQ